MTVRKRKKNSSAIDQTEKLTEKVITSETMDNKTAKTDGTIA